MIHAGRPRILVLILLFAASVSAESAGIPACAPQTFETTRLLVPVLADRIAGADGSVWTTELWISNVTDCPVLFPLAPCQVSCCCDEFSTYRAQEAVSLALDHPRGRWFNVPADGSLQFQARFRDLSRAASSAGVELALVREADFRADQVNLIGIPRDPRFRVTLRLYSLSGGTTLRVDTVDLFGATIATQVVALEPPTEIYAGTIPAYAQLSMPPAGIGDEPVRLRIVPLSAGSRVWAFASITNNETSEVTVVQPSW